MYLEVARARKIWEAAYVSILDCSIRVNDCYYYGLHNYMAYA